MNMKLISRDFYLRQLDAVRDIPDINVNSLKIGNFSF